MLLVGSPIKSRSEFQAIRNAERQVGDGCRTQMPLCVSTGDWDAVLRQIRWYTVVQTLVNCHCKLEVGPVWNVQYLTKAAIKLPSTVTTCAAVFSTRCNLSFTIHGAPARMVLQ